jgi:hypothetical protein
MALTVDFDQYCKDADRRQREWDALPEDEKDRQRRTLAGWADRIEAENEALELQVRIEQGEVTE